MTWESRLDGGSERFLNNLGMERNSPVGLRMVEDNSNRESPRDFATGSLSSTPQGRPDYQNSNPGLMDTGSPPSPFTPLSTYGRNRPVLESLSSLEISQSNDQARQIGPLSESWPSEENSPMSPMTYLYVIICLSPESLETILSRLPLNASVLFTGVEQGLENPGRRGMKEVWTLTRKIRSLNGGMRTRVSLTLLSMNFAEQYRFPIYCDGSIVIQCLWRQREDRQSLGPNGSGSPQTLTPVYGTPSSTPER